MKIGTKITNREMLSLLCLKFENKDKILILNCKKNTVLILNKFKRYGKVSATMKFLKKEDARKCFKFFVNKEFIKMDLI